MPWDHIDVGLEDGFLLSEYRKAMKGRASPPCGKVAGMLIHHTNLADAEPDRRRLVCYDCGVACDVTKMRADRLVALRALGATEKPQRALPVVTDGSLVDVSERGGGSPAERGEVSKAKDRETERAERVRLAGHFGAGLPYTTYRIRFAKVGRAAFLGHLDLVRLLALVNTAMADAGIAIWESKYHYVFWRPVTGIREADPDTGPTSAGDGNDNTQADPTFSPLGRRARSASARQA